MAFVQNIFYFLENYLPQFVVDKLGTNRSSKVLLLFSILSFNSFSKHEENKLFLLQHDKLQYILL